MIVRVGKTLCALLAALLACYGATPSEASTTTHESTATWPTDFMARLEALALLQTLNAELLSNDSATQTLEGWCTAHRLAANPRIVADPVPSPDVPPTENQLRELAAYPSDSVRHRKVRILCGTTVLSEVDNWYVPARLTPEMNGLLDTTNLPFDKVVQELHFRRHTLSASLLWRPLPEGWELGSVNRPTDSVGEGPAIRRLPSHVLIHRAMLTLPNGTPFSEVVESYTGSVLAFPYPTLPEIVVVARRSEP
jgi:hypothetical protein